MPPRPRLLHARPGGGGVVAPHEEHEERPEELPPAQPRLGGAAERPHGPRDAAVLPSSSPPSEARAHRDVRTGGNEW